MAFICPWSGWRALSAGAFLVMCASGSWTTCSAQSDARALEYKVKAAFLYRFASYVEWPPQVLPRADSPLVIGVIGADVLGDGSPRLSLTARLPAVQ